LKVCVTTLNDNYATPRIFVESMRGNFE